MSEEKHKVFIALNGEHREIREVVENDWLGVESDIELVGDILDAKVVVTDNIQLIVDEVTHPEPRPRKYILCGHDPQLSGCPNVYMGNGLSKAQILSVARGQKYIPLGHGLWPV